MNTNLYTCLSVCLHIVPFFPFRRAGVNKSIGCSGDFCLANSRGQRLLIRFLCFKGIWLEGPPLTVKCTAVTGACLSRVPARFTPKFIGAAGVPRPGRRLRSALVSRSCRPTDLWDGSPLGPPEIYPDPQPRGNLEMVVLLLGGQGCVGWEAWLWPRLVGICPLSVGWGLDILLFGVQCPVMHTRMFAEYSADPVHPVCVASYQDKWQNDGTRGYLLSWELLFVVGAS